MSRSAFSTRSCVAPIRARACPVYPWSAVIARGRCSVETYSSPSAVVSFWACWRTRPSRAVAESWTFPWTFGWRASSCCTAARSCCGDPPRASMTLGTIPPCCASSAAKSSSTSSCERPFSCAACCAVMKASWVFSVIFFGSIIQPSPLEQVRADVVGLAALGQLAHERALLVGELRREDDLDRHVEIAVPATRSWHALAGEPDGATVLRLRRDPQAHPALQCRHRHLGAEQRLV